MLLKCTAVCLVALALLPNFCGAQNVGRFSEPFPGKKRPGTQWPQDPQQQKQTFDKPISWNFPADPKPEPKPDVKFEMRHPVPAASVAVACRESTAYVEVKRDFFGVGQLIDPADLTLGTCGNVGVDALTQVLIYEAHLHECGSVLTMTQDAILYTFTMNYSPKPLGGSPVVRSSKAAVIVECYYPRKHNVSSLPLEPVWVPFSSVKMAEEFLYFTLRLMTDDWQYERPVYQYFLGDAMNFEVSVKQYYHVPLRIFVDSCVATLSTDSSSSPRYTFIEQGCLIDARITGSDSRFLARTAENKLHFQIEAFRFLNTNSEQLYITCHLTAVSVASGVDSNHRACSYISGWREANGFDGVCNSCESIGFGQIGTTGVLTGSTGGGTGNTGGGTGNTGGGTGNTGGGTGNTGGGTGSTGGGTGSTGGGTGSTGGGTGSTGGGTGNTGGGTRNTGGGTGNTGGGTRYTSVNWGIKSYPNKQQGRNVRDVSQQEILEWEGDITLGPIPIKDRTE